MPRTTAPVAYSRTTLHSTGRRLLTATLATALITTAAACAGDEEPATEGLPGSSGEAEALEPAVTVEAGPPPTIELVDAGDGDGDRRVLAYAPSLEPAVVDVTRSGAASTVVPGGDPRTEDTPAQTLTVEGLSEPDVDGAQRATVTVREFTSVDELRNAQFATASGFTVTWTRSADGVVSRYSLAAPEGATDAARAGVEITANAVADATVAWPTEAIGVGARWTVTSTVDDAVAPERVVTYELVELDDDARVATVRMSEAAPDAADSLTAPAPDGGPDVSLDVETYEVSRSGELTVDLRAALPVAGTTESSTRAVYSEPDTGDRTSYDEDSVLEFSPGA